MNRIARYSFRTGIALVIVLLVLSTSPGSAAATGIHANSGTGPALLRANLRHGFAVVPLDSDGFVQAPSIDQDLVNAWGLAASGAGALWVANNGTDRATIYTGGGVAQSLVVPLPPGSAPTGVAFYSGNNFVLADGTHEGPARFLFAGEAGQITGWGPSISPPGQPPTSVVAVDRSGAGAIYKAVALMMTGSGDRLYATDFHNGRVDVFDGAFQPVTLGRRAFVDPYIPAGFAPFGIAAIQGRIVVTFAKQDSSGEDDVAGTGLGFVSVFDADGAYLARIGTRGPLNAPWGLALAPAGFGWLGGHLLVGNFGDGKIVAYKISDDFRLAIPVGVLRGANGRPVVIDGLWAIAFAPGAVGAPAHSLFFTAGPGDEHHGLFGRIEPR